MVQDITRIMKKLIIFALISKMFNDLLQIFNKPLNLDSTKNLKPRAWYPRSYPNIFMLLSFVMFVMNFVSLLIGMGYETALRRRTSKIVQPYLKTKRKFPDPFCHDTKDNLKFKGLDRIGL